MNEGGKGLSMVLQKLTAEDVFALSPIKESLFSFIGGKRDPLAVQKSSEQCGVDDSPTSINQCPHQISEPHSFSSMDLSLAQRT